MSRIIFISFWIVGLFLIPEILQAQTVSFSLGDNLPTHTPVTDRRIPFLRKSFDCTGQPSPCLPFEIDEFTGTHYIEDVAPVVTRTHDQTAGTHWFVQDVSSGEGYKYFGFAAGSLLSEIGYLLDDSRMATIASVLGLTRAYGVELRFVCVPDVADYRFHIPRPSNIVTINKLPDVSFVETDVSCKFDDSPDDPLELDGELELTFNIPGLWEVFVRRSDGANMELRGIEILENDVLEFRSRKAYLNGVEVTSPALVGEYDFSPGTYTLVIQSLGIVETARTWYPEIGEPNLISVGSITTSPTTCFGEPSGSITIAGSGGTPIYRYKVNDGSYTGGSSGAGTISGIEGATDHVVYVMDANGCEVSQGGVEVDDAPQIIPDISVTQMECHGQRGSITVRAAGGNPFGTSAYRFGITGPIVIYPGTGSASTSSATSLTRNNLVAGDYIVTIIDESNCSLDVTYVTIDPEPELFTLNNGSSSVNPVITDVQCHGENTGSVRVTAYGGTPPFRFKFGSESYSSASTNRQYTRSNLTAGSYAWSFLDANGCELTGTADVEEPDELVFVSTDPTAPSCLSQPSESGSFDADGTIDVEVEGATRPYQYRVDGGDWSSNQSGFTYTFTCLSAGDHIIEVRGRYDCEPYGSETVTVPNPTNTVQVAATPTAAGCTGGTNGSILVDASQGNPYSTSSYQFRLGSSGSFSSARTNITYNNLSPGDYTVCAKDENGCVDCTTVEIVVDDSRKVVLDTFNETQQLACDDGKFRGTFHNNTGNVSIVALEKMNGSAWDPVDPSTYFSLVSNTYDFIRVEELDSEGRYRLIITDGINCNDTSEAILTKTTPDITFSAVRPHVRDGDDFYFCDDTRYVRLNFSGVGSTMRVRILQGGVQQYQYTGANTTVSFETDVTGTFDVQLFPTSACTEYEEFSFGMFYETPSVTVTPKDLSCNGDGSGELAFTVTGSRETYSVSYNGTSTYQNVNASNQYTRTGLSAGSYNYRIQDGDNCIWDFPNATITQPNVLEFSTLPSFTDIDGYEILCNGGTVDVSATIAGGTANYAVSLTRSGTSGSTDDNDGDTDISFSNIGAGDYNLEVTDANNCKVDTDFTLDEPVALSSTQISSTPPVCPNADDGSFVVRAANGNAFSGGYRYEIIGLGALGVTTNTTGIDFGSYQSSLGDPNPTTAITQATFTRPQGEYIVRMTDKNGCTTDRNVTISGPSSPLTIGFSVEAASCDEIDDGVITILATQGAGSYRYYVNGAESTNADKRIFTGLDGNTDYTISIRDANDCEVSQNNVSPGIILNPVDVGIENITIPFCNSADGLDNTATIEVRGAGGKTGNFSFSLNDEFGTYVDNGTDTYTFTGVSPSVPGDHIVYVKDDVGCIGQVNATVNEAPSIQLSYDYNLDPTRTQSEYILCPGETSDLTVNVTNGNYPMSVSLSGTTEAGATYGPINRTATVSGQTLSFNDVPAGDYQVDAADHQTCETTSVLTQLRTAVKPTVSTAQGKSLRFQSGVNYHISCNAGSDGEINIVVGSGEFGDFNIELFADGTTTGQVVGVAQGETAIFSGLSAKSGGSTIDYTYEISNNLNPSCTWTYSDVINLTEPDELQLVDHYSTPGPFNGYEIDCFGNDIGYQVEFSGGIYPFTIRINDNSDGSLVDVQNVTLGSSKETLFSGLVEGSYTITLQDDFGTTCQVTDNFTLDAPPLLVPSFSDILAPSCLAGTDGSITISAAGGVPASGEYTFNITDYSLTAPLNLSGETCETIDLSSIVGSQAVFALPSGTYDFEVVDNNGCTQSLEDLVIPLRSSPLQISSVVATETSCYGGTDGTLTVQATGGTTLPGNEYKFTLTGGNLSTPYELFGVGQVTFENLESTDIVGTYEVFVEDADACCEILGYNYNENITLGTPDPVVVTLVSAETDQPDCFGGTDGSMLTIQATGGVPPYEFSTDGTNFSSSALGDKFRLTNIEGGLNYQFYVRDANYVVTQPTCVTPYDYTLPDGPQIEITVSKDNASCFGASDVSFETFVAFTGSLRGLNTNSIIDESAFTYEWRNLDTDEVIANTKDVNNLGAGNYRISVSRVGTGCSEQKNVTVGQPVEPLSVDEIEVFNESCSGNNDGAAMLTISGGAPVANQNMRYSLDGGGTFLTLGNDFVINGLSEGNYNIIIQNGEGCQASDSFVIDAYELIVDASISNEVSCFNGADGEITVDVSMNYPDFTLPTQLEYSLDDIDYQVSNVFSGLSSGDYVIYVRDQSNTLCTGASGTVTMENPLEIVIDASIESQEHCDLGDGVAKVTVTNAVNPVITWLDADNNIADGNNLAAGNYTIRVTDDNSCLKEVSFEMTEAPTMILATTVTEDTYCQLPQGSAEVDVTNGEGPYTYTWVNGSHTLNGQSVSGMYDGEYELTVEDSFGCQVVTTVTIQNEEAFTIEVLEIVETACGISQGEISLQANGDYGPYNYSWDDGSTGSSRTGLSTGLYQVTVTDQRGCSQDSIFYVAPEGDVITSSANVIQPVCENTAGEIEITDVTGGTAPFTYSWFDEDLNSIGSNNSVISGLGVGSYYVAIEDASGCEFLQPVIVLTSDTSQEPLANVSILNSPYCDESNGDVLVEMSTGTPPFELMLTNSLAEEVATINTTENSVELNDLGADNYELSIKDTNGCEITSGFSLEELDDPSITVDNIIAATSSIPAGSFEVSISDDHGSAYQYFLTDAALSTETYSSSPIENLTAGDYTVYAANDECQSNTALVSVPSYDDLELTVVSIQQSTCENAQDGSIEVSVSGGLEPYTFNWSHDASIDGSMADGLDIGDYVITVEDSIGSSATTEISLSVLSDMEVVNTATVEPLCFEGCDGSIELTISGGSGNYNVVWDNGQSGAAISNLCAGTYTAYIEDQLNSACFLEHVVVINQPSEIEIQTSNTSSPSCVGGSDGTLTLTVSGGNESFEITWPDGQTGLTAFGLSAGSYNVEVVDIVGDCVHQYEAVLQDPDPISVVSATLVQPSCYGGADGSITVVLENTTNPLVTWSNGDQGLIASNLSAGSYSFSLLDANGCEFDSSFVLGEPTEMLLTGLSTIETLCAASSDGTATIEVEGGTGAYSVVWSKDGITLSSLENQLSVSGLSEGIYLFEVTDEQSCQLIGELQMSSPTEVSISDIVLVQPLCNGDSNGQISVEATGGAAPYSYFIDGTAFDHTATGLASGSYDIQIVDSNDCSITETIVLEEPRQLAIASTDIQNVSCFEGSDGSIEVELFGGTAPYEFIWSTGSVESSTHNLSAGNHSVTITDANGCEISEEFTVGQPDPISPINQVLIDPTCYEGEDGSISLGAQGGTAPYQFSWAGGQEGSFISGLTDGDYSVTITDDNDCVQTVEYSINEPSELFITTLPGNTVEVCDGGDAILDGGEEWAQYQWYHEDELFSSDRKVMVEDAGTYQLTAYTEQGCSAEESVNVEVTENPLNADFVFDSDIVIGDTLIIIDVSWPIPESIQWVIPDSVTRLSADETVFFQSIIFPNPGTYTFGMYAYDDNCFDYVEKVFTVTERLSEETAGRVTLLNEPTVVKSIISPNPGDGNFDVEVKLDRPSPVEIRLYDFDRNLIDHQRKDKGAITYEFEVRKQGLEAGIYLLIIESMGSTKVEKIVVR
ncbi:MAG: T9SS type A sorting domain-containing protein [bacterium]|nr:T9SS type A sorting domain-containing protein [bacterium]